MELVDSFTDLVLVVVFIEEMHGDAHHSRDTTFGTPEKGWEYCSQVTSDTFDNF